MLQSDALHGIIPWIDGLSFVGIVAGVVKGSDWLDSMLNDTGRAAITKWLKNVPSEAQDDSWPQALSGLIDRVFGERPFSLKFILRSFVASIIAVTLVWLVYARLQLRLGNGVQNYTGIIVISLVVNLIPDYLSLLVSRAIIMLIPRNPRLHRVISLLIADAALTALIPIISLSAGYLMLGSHRTFKYYDPIVYIDTWRTHAHELRASYVLSSFSLATDSPMATLDVFIYSSFFTSLWLWLYVTAGFAIKGSRRLHFLWMRVSKYLDIDNKPLGCIGKVSGLLLASLWFIFIGLEHALHYMQQH
jgi:hypothetical protein